MGGSCETKEEGCSVVSWKTADVTALCAMGSNQGWQSEAEELGDQQAEQHGQPCEVITWMAGANDTAVREPVVGLSPGLRVTAMDNGV